MEDSPNCCGENRRGFCATTATIALGLAAYAVPAVTALLALLNPLRQKSQSGQFIRLASLAVLPEDGTPRKFPVIADRSDAWNRFPAEPIGAVYLRRLGPKQVQAFQVVCPHAGCFVSYDGPKNIFFCPCHNASFDLEGKRLDAVSPSPRDLDSLDVELRNDAEVWVKFENFRTGTSQKIA